MPAPESLLEAGRSGPLSVTLHPADGSLPRRGTGTGGDFCGGGAVPSHPPDLSPASPVCAQVQRRPGHLPVLPACTFQAMPCPWPFSRTLVRCATQGQIWRGSSWPCTWSLPWGSIRLHSPHCHQAVHSALCCPGPGIARRPSSCWHPAMSVPGWSSGSPRFVQMQSARHPSLSGVWLRQACLPPGQV